MDRKELEAMPTGLDLWLSANGRATHLLSGHLSMSGNSIVCHSLGYGEVVNGTYE